MLMLVLCVSSSVCGMWLWYFSGHTHLLFAISRDNCYFKIIVVLEIKHCILGIGIMATRLEYILLKI